MKAFEQRVAAAWPPAAWQDVTVIAAVSGGADSVALLRALASLKTAGAGRLLVAHFNHGLRGVEAHADEQFVAELCERLRLPCWVGHAAPGALVPNGHGVEALARKLRYRFLQAAAEEAGARYVVTAHTADDQAETILHRIFRGTALSGLTGIRRHRHLGDAATLLRPLLDFRRVELRRYLQELEQTWCEDATNADTHATRNWIRNELLPLVEERINPAAAEAIVRLGHLASEGQAVLQALANQLGEQALRLEGENTLVCNCAGLVGQNRYLVREMFLLAWRQCGWPEQAITFAHWDLLAEMALGDPGQETWQRDFPGGLRAKKRRAAVADAPGGLIRLTVLIVFLAGLGRSARTACVSPRRVQRARR